MAMQWIILDLYNEIEKPNCFIWFLSAALFTGGNINNPITDTIFPHIMCRKSIGRKSVDWTLIPTSNVLVLSLSNGLGKN
jgi:hypothetical protein